ncbi:MAG: phage baseplate protein, partial [Chloroflexi bacterium]|nr:phage baseplate protein [Chloroflexota bacterium]
IDRALTLLALIFPNQTRQTLATLSIGQRDGYLLDLYEAVFGARLASQARCPACQHQVEFNFTLSDIRVAAPVDRLNEQPLRVTGAGYTLNFRLINSLDLALIIQHDPAEARRKLVEQCLLSASHNGEAVSAGSLPDEAITLLATQLARHDPQADIELALVCPSCEQGWPLLFDIVPFLWAKIDAQARRLLREVHALARVYGWREPDILALSPVRRQFYLEMVSE